jgi:hypothetical protein
MCGILAGLHLVPLYNLRDSVRVDRDLKAQRRIGYRESIKTELVRYVGHLYPFVSLTEQATRLTFMEDFK